MIPPKLNRPKELLSYLEMIGTVPKKHLSQNFLIDGNILKKITIFSTVSSEDTVLEIGPGPGALTDALLATHANVIVVEKDPLFAKALEKRESTLSVLCQDILETDLDALFKKHAQQKKLKVVGNLPYHLTTPILLKFLPRHDLFSSITVMVQKEVAERLIASPGSKTYSSLTLFANLYSSTHFGFKVSRRSFYPAPKVDSAVIQFHLICPPKEVKEENFFVLTRTAFGKRRKMLTSSLSSLYPKEAIAASLREMNVSEKARPELLSAPQFIHLFQILEAVKKQKNCDHK